VQSLAAIPQLGFIHEDSGQAFVLDIADLYRDTVTLQIAFSVAKNVAAGDDTTIDRLVRREASAVFRKQSVISSMIDKIKLVLRTEEHDVASSDSDA
jgi:CRISPR-associated protein Cas1